VLVEINDLGGQVADIIHSELEYENLLKCTHRGRKGQVMDGGFGTGTKQFGVRTSEVVKKLGCSVLKSLLEGNSLVVEDFDTIKELYSFVSKKNSYEAESGYNDDLVMTLVMFAWCSTQPYFKDLTNMDIKKEIYKEAIEKLEEEMTPYDFMLNDGLDEGESGTVTDFGNDAVWSRENAQRHWQDHEDSRLGWY
jgi:histone deacetylase complex regulatory component SIN3